MIAPKYQSDTVLTRFFDSQIGHDVEAPIARASVAIDCSPYGALVYHLRFCRDIKDAHLERNIDCLVNTKALIQLALNVRERNGVCDIVSMCLCRTCRHPYLLDGVIQKAGVLFSGG